MLSLLYQRLVGKILQSFIVLRVSIVLRVRRSLSTSLLFLYLNISVAMNMASAGFYDSNFCF